VGVASAATDARVHRQAPRSALLPRIDPGRLAVETSVAAKGRVARASLNAHLTRPLLLVDIDGVVSLFGFSPTALADLRSVGSFHWIDGIPHFLSASAAAHLLALGEIFELVWCSGWEERANEYLPALLGLPAELPFLSFGDATDRGPGNAGGGAGNTGGAGDAREAGHVTSGLDGGGAERVTRGHWKLAAIDAYAGTRALAWIDDCLDEACHAWAAARAAPTLLVQTDAAVGITAAHVERLLRWAQAAPAS
jgi:hypothetical protein